MAEYIELIDKYRINYYDSPYSDYAPPSYEWVDNTGEIVRCKDCVRYEISKNRYDGTCNRHYAVFTVNDFCSYGERKGGDAE